MLLLVKYALHYTTLRTIYAQHGLLMIFFRASIIHHHTLWISEKTLMYTLNENFALILLESTLSY